MTKPKKISKKQPGLINRRASFDYNLEQQLTVGMVLSGHEVRAARDGHIQLKGAYVGIKDNELWLNNASFSLRLNEKGINDRVVDSSPRKLLASRQQISSLIAQRKAGYSIVPVRLINNGRFIKLVIALGRGKKLYDKRETIKKRQQARETKQEL